VSDITNVHVIDGASHPWISLVRRAIGVCVRATAHVVDDVCGDTRARTGTLPARIAAADWSNQGHLPARPRRD